MKNVIPTRTWRYPFYKGGALLLWLSALVASIYILLCLLLWSRQEGLIFVRPEENLQAVKDIKSVRRLEVSARDGTLLRGWVKESTARSNTVPLVIYFGGNAEDVSNFVAHNRLPDAWTLVAVNYRGFGASEGAPSSDALVDDALRVFDEGVLLPRVDRSHVVVMGRSLGTGVATWVSKSRDVAATILVSPYDSFQRVAADHYPWVPVSWLMRHEFAAAAWARETSSKLIAVVGTADDVVRPERSHELFGAWHALSKKLVEIPDAGHTLYPIDAFWVQLGGALVDVFPNQSGTQKQAPSERGLLVKTRQ